MKYKNETTWPDNDKLDIALKKALEIVDRNMKKFEDAFPIRVDDKLQYEIAGNEDWTAGFWPGILWLCYELTGDEKYAKCAEGYVDSFYERIDKKLHVNHHDMGFLYSLSCVPAYTLKGNQKAKQAAIMAADHLCERFMEKGGFINAWSRNEDVRPEDNFYIIDCLMNIPLLYWATRETGNERYAKIADTHLKTTIKTIIREDNSTYHSFLFDVETGKPLKGVTQQGFSDESAWSRGQAWGVLGFALNYAYTNYAEDLDCFKRVTDYFINHLPDDGVAYWDLIFTEGDEPRDSSASAITVCGILEMQKYVNDADINRFSKIGAHIMHSLIDKYAATADMNTDGLLLRGTGSVPHNIAVDKPTLYGDYFYLEAILRLKKKDWKIYW